MIEVSETFCISLPKVKRASTKAVVADVHPVLNYSFVDRLWCFEITGGLDQNRPLTVVNVKNNSLAKRSGIKVGDEIMYINKKSTENMTLLDAQLEILHSGKSLKIIVRGDISDESSSEDDSNIDVDFWFKPMSLEQVKEVEWDKKRDAKRKITKQIYQGFPWNDRAKAANSLRSSNCYMASSTDKVQAHEREIKLKATKSQYNTSEASRQQS